MSQRSTIAVCFLVPLFAALALGCGSSETQPEAKAPVTPITSDGQTLGADGKPPENGVKENAHVSVSADGAKLEPAATPASSEPGGERPAK